MPDVRAKFVHPTDQRVVTVTVDDTMTAEEAIGELLANNFVPPAPMGYELNVGPTRLRADQSLADAGVTDDSKIRVTPSTDAGAPAGRLL